MKTRARIRLVGGIGLATWGLFMAAVAGEPAPAMLASPFLFVVALGLAVGGKPTVRVEVGAVPHRLVVGQRLEVTAQVTAPPPGHRISVHLQPSQGVTRVEGPERTVELLANGSISYRWELEATRWGPVDPIGVSVRVTDRFGLYETEAHGATGRLKVLPPASLLRRMLSPRTLRTVPGAHLSRQRAEGIEFADLRPFTTGDQARTINWRASARRGELWVDQRHPERSGEVVLFIDSFAQAGQGRDDTLRRSIEVAQALSASHLAVNDRVGLVDLGGVFRWVRPAGGARQMYRIAEALLDTEVWSSHADKPLEIIPVRALPHRSLVVALSPLLDPRGVNAISRMRGRGLDVVALEVAPAPVMAATASARSRLAERLWRLERIETRQQLRAQGVAVVEWAPEAPIERVMDELLKYRQRQK